MKILQVLQLTELPFGRVFRRVKMLLLPKRADAHQLHDYRPICLIHLVAKLFAKVLSLRLAPR
uniref:Reverse transcriptase domain-containing protein n=1 Tax=Aegilops tauschii subsp. strangulata TaxID=200361 RepID=A0A453EX66_AEGTS